MSSFSGESEFITVKFPGLKKLVHSNCLEFNEHRIERLKEAPHMIHWRSIIECFFGRSVARSKGCEQLIREHGSFMDISLGDSCIIFQDQSLQKLFPTDQKQQRFTTNVYLNALRHRTNHPYWTLYFHPQHVPSEFVILHIPEMKELIKEFFDDNGAKHMDDYQLCDYVGQLKTKMVHTINEVYENEKSKRPRTV